MVRFWYGSVLKHKTAKKNKTAKILLHVFDRKTKIFISLIVLKANKGAKWQVKTVRT